MSCDIKGTKQTVAVVATLGQVRQSSDYRSAEAASSSLSHSCQRQARVGEGDGPEEVGEGGMRCISLNT